MGLITVHAWYADRFQTLCDITGVNKTSGLIRHTTIPVNCPTCLRMLRRHGFDEFKHEIMQNEYSITRRMKATPLLATPVEDVKEEISQPIEPKNGSDEELQTFDIPTEQPEEVIVDDEQLTEFDISEEQPEQEEDDQQLETFDIPTEQPEEEDQNLKTDEIEEKAIEIVEKKQVEDVESEKSLSPKPASKKTSKPKPKPKR